MATAYYPDIKWYYWDGDSWEDISGYVLTKNGVSGHWGMRSNKYTDRLAATGEMRMLLDNAAGVFDPDDASVLTGWAINTKVKMVVTYDGVSYTRFYGKVDTLKFSDPNTHEHTAQVLVSDWMGYAYKKTLTDRSIETFKSGGELASEIITAVGQTPLATNIAEGDYEFPAAFDGVTTTTKAATELNKIVLSENGYFYNRHDKVNGETVTFEAESTRNGLRTVSKLPKLAADCGHVLMAGSATDHVLMAGSATDKVVINETQDAHINGTAQAYQRTHGENILNRVTVTAYPKRVDTVEQTIYSLGTPLMLAPGETKTVNVKYQNVTTKESCNAITELCSQPVATTDYLMNRNKAGTSTNITANLTVSVVFHTASADVTFTNASGFTGYVTRLYLKGYGVYQDASIKAEASDSTSITAYGDRELNIEQQYQRDSVMGEGLAAKILETEKDPRTKLEKVTLIANTSSVHMLAFLNVDIGDMVKITESDLNLADYYYVNGIEFSVAEGDVITFSWVLNELFPCEYDDGLTAIAIEFTDVDQAIELPSIQELSNPDELSIITTVYFNPDSINELRFIIGKWSDVLTDAGLTTTMSGYRFMYQNYLNDIRLYTNYFFNNDYIYGKSTFSIVPSEWVRIAVVMNKHQRTVKHYLSGVCIDDTPGLGMNIVSGMVFNDDDSNPIRIGATYRSNVDGGVMGYGNVLALDGMVKNIFIYDTALSDEEIAADASNPGCITRGLVSSLIYVPTGDLAHYADLEMTADDTIMDNFTYRLGVPVNSPTSRLII